MDDCKYENITIDPSDKSTYGIVEIDHYEFQYKRNTLSNLKDDNNTVRGVIFPKSLNLDNEPLIRYLVQVKTKNVSKDAKSSELLEDAIKPKNIERFNKQLLEDILKNYYIQLGEFLQYLKVIKEETEIAQELANVLKNLISADIKNGSFNLDNYFGYLNDLIPSNNQNNTNSAETAKKDADSWNVHDFVFQAFRDNAKQQCEEFLTIDYELTWENRPPQFKDFKWMKAFIKLINNDKCWNEFSKRIFEINSIERPNSKQTIGQNVNYHLAQ
ncbi:hypothetical protein TVAG_357830 [Trichomonas vaginalis G3]|uniref:Uncharacterized protein n=1 Tax=Trichomonas vaginalis (strain ATCC PRA-98 / G3) TaxID=412133 RepID=A2F3D0_TRIV3|nr:hypothetical protein TVAGG3_0161300 [Trichomonas vaginalis G3]EAY00577.1 hypothetical protein TVAG_357830 [Trichomonas vaginalis G3]KAI5547888.1 hypothetical protein TVAGG3_0161300 [Trichomonas vaginalis G3]|eukprot:XP_001313506.1 hypothetical protein [Trichomonas vaginalis G3]